MLISLTSLTMTSKFQKNICFKTRAVGLINIKTKEYESGLLQSTNIVPTKYHNTFFKKNGRINFTFAVHSVKLP